MKKIVVSSFSAALLLSSAVASVAQLTIDPGVISLTTDPAVQTFDLTVANSGDAQMVTVLQLNIQIDVPEGQSAVRPKITQVDILTGTPFQNDNNGLFGDKVTDFKWEIGTTADSTAPDPSLTGHQSSKVATITFDTTGVSPGTWTFNLTTGAGPTTYHDETDAVIPLTLVNGTLTVVPEMNGMAMVGLVLLGFAFVRRVRFGRSMN